MNSPKPEISSVLDDEDLSGVRSAQSLNQLSNLIFNEFKPKLEDVVAAK